MPKIDWDKPIEIIYDDGQDPVPTHVVGFDERGYAVFDDELPNSPWFAYPSGEKYETGHIVRNTQPQESLHIEPAPDNFKTESPIRAFTEFRVDGLYAIGMGLRPSLAHLTKYLDAMETNEGWRLVQILESATAKPSFVFRKVL